jgi:hypothetical protein
MAIEMKACEACGQEIASNETTCPKCRVVFAELEEDVTTFDRLWTVADKRRKAKEEKEKADKEKENPPAPPTPPAPKKRKLFGGRNG